MSFPTTLTNAVDGVTEIVAAHLNNLEAKVGIDNSGVATSLDYLLKNSASINPGPFEFHSEPAHVLTWMSKRGLLFCRRSQVRSIMRPVWLPVEPHRLGLCDGLHRDAHEFVEPSDVLRDQS